MPTRTDERVRLVRDAAARLVLGRDCWDALRVCMFCVGGRSKGVGASQTIGGRQEGHVLLACLDATGVFNWEQPSLTSATPHSNSAFTSCRHGSAWLRLHATWQRCLRRACLRGGVATTMPCMCSTDDALPRRPSLSVWGPMSIPPFCWEPVTPHLAKRNGFQMSACRKPHTPTTHNNGADARHTHEKKNFLKC